MKTKTRKIIERIVNVILLIEFIILVAGGWICGLMANNKIATFEKQYQTDMEELEIRVEELENEILENRCEVLYGKFIGVNSYGDKSYCVVSINGKEYETIGNKNCIFVMNEEVIIFKIDNVLYSMSLK